MKESMEEMINTIVESMKSLNRQAFSVYKLLWMKFVLEEQ